MEVHGALSQKRELARAAPGFWASYEAPGHKWDFCTGAEQAAERHFGGCTSVNQPLALRICLTFPGGRAGSVPASHATKGPRPGRRRPGISRSAGSALLVH